MAAGDLVDLTSVKAWLKVTTSDDDAMLNALIADASAFIPQYIQRVILTTICIENFIGNGKNRQMTRNNPIQSVSMVRWPGTTITQQGDPFNNIPGYYVEGKHVYLVGSDYPFGVPVEITYTAGWATAPSDIKQACLELVGEAYRRRTHIGETSHAAGGNTTVAFDTSIMHDMIDQRLQNWIRVAPI